MKLSLSCRIAEGFRKKEEPIMTLEALADLAVAAGYDAICMRASQVGVQSPAEQVQAARATLDRHNLGVTMISGDFDIVYNNERGPNCLREIRPYLDLALALGAPLIRVCLKSEDDVVFAQRAADEAAEAGLVLVHQCHTRSRFETVDDIVDTLKQIDRPNFGLIYEPANLELCRQDYREAVQLLAPWIRNVYLQNQSLNPAGAFSIDTWHHGPLSFDIIQIHESGGIEFQGIFDALRNIDYDGNITVHQSAPDDGLTTPVEAATQTASFLRNTWHDASPS